MTSEAFLNVVNKYISVGDNLMEGKLMLAFLISYKLSSEDIQQNPLKGHKFTKKIRFKKYPSILWRERADTGYSAIIFRVVQARK